MAGTEAPLSPLQVNLQLESRTSHTRKAAKIAKAADYRKLKVGT